MKSSKRRSSTSLGGKLAGLALVLSVLLLVFKQTGYKMKAPDGENVLGTSSSYYDTSVEVDGSFFACKSVGCRTRESSQKNCTSLKDNGGQSVCQWTQFQDAKKPRCTVSSRYKSSRTHESLLYFAALKKYPSFRITESLVYNCKKIVGNPVCTVGLNKACGPFACSNLGYANCSTGLTCIGLKCVPKPTSSNRRPNGGLTPTQADPKPNSAAR